MLMLVVMVMMSLGISQRVREKMELNTLAETTAYSNAVATARAYNAVALMNRAAIAHWINLAGVESLISWTGLFFAESNMMMEAVLPHSAFGGGISGLDPPFIQQLPGYSGDPDCQHAMANILWNPFYDSYVNDLQVDWVRFLDEAAKAGEQGRKLQNAIGALRGAESGIVGDLRGMIGSHALATAIVAQAQQSDLGTGAGGVDGANLGWLGGPQEGLDSDKVWWAVMDARSPWVKNRSNDPILTFDQSMRRAIDRLKQPNQPLLDVLKRVEYGKFQMFGDVFYTFETRGHGCFGEDFGNCESGPDWTNALAEDRVVGTVNIAINRVKGTTADGKTLDCPAYVHTAQIGNKSQVKASDIDHDDDFAWFDTRNYGGTSTANGLTSPIYSQLEDTAYTKHTMGPCTDNFLLRPCHSVYVGIVSLNHGAPLGGQAKNFAGVTRSHAKHAGATRDPWDLKFRFHFRDTGPGSAIDLGKAGDGDAVAVGTGVAYYHRRGAFSETPNLFNPYWRGTLIGANRKGGPAGLPGEAAEAWGALQASGYRGEN